jgi:hypothetical protein
MKSIIDKYSTVYCFDIYVVINPNKAELDKRFKWAEDDSSLYNDDYSKLTAYTCIGVIDKSNDRECIVVILNSLQDTAWNINTFAHEGLHVTMAILNSCKVEYSEESEEAFAYLQGYVTECIYKTAQKS